MTDNRASLHHNDPMFGYQSGNLFALSASSNSLADAPCLSHGGLSLTGCVAHALSYVPAPVPMGGCKVPPMHSQNTTCALGEVAVLVDVGKVNAHARLAAQIGHLHPACLEGKSQWSHSVQQSSAADVAEKQV